MMYLKKTKAFLKRGYESIRTYVLDLAFVLDRWKNKANGEDIISCGNTDFTL